MTTAPEILSEASLAALWFVSCGRHPRQTAVAPPGITVFKGFEIELGR